MKLTTKNLRKMILKEMMAYPSMINLPPSHPDDIDHEKHAGMEAQEEAANTIFEIEELLNNTSLNLSADLRYRLEMIIKELDETFGPRAY